MRVDVHEPGLNVGNASRLRVQFPLHANSASRSRSAFSTTSDEAFRTVRRFLCEAADPPAWGIVMVPASSAIHRESRETELICRRRCGRQSARAPGTICAELLSIRSRPAIRTEMSVIESNAGFSPERPKKRNRL